MGNEERVSMEDPLTADGGAGQAAEKAPVDAEAGRSRQPKGRARSRRPVFGEVLASRQ